MGGPASETTAPVGLIAAGGVLPFAVADAIVARGQTPVLFALKGICDPKPLARFRHHWIGLGQLGNALKLLKAEGVRDLMFIGNLVRPAVSEIRFDWGTLRELPYIWSAFRGGDDHLLSGVGRIFERHGFHMIGVKDVAPNLLVPEGHLTRSRPNDLVAGDIAKGLAVLRAMAPFDVGQAVVVIDGHVVALEDIEGTDGLLARVARLRADRRIRSAVGRGVLVKAPKAGQDLRYDLPTIGPRTVEGLSNAGLAGVAVASAHTLLADPQETVTAADRAGVFITGVTA
ncbi:UDP-2,3-diacylglucosamine diphosphatase LpxI [Bradyrhizobium sp. 83002]|uniref:LpxI family protein n=1 Tax=Bradyrhizobium aeschynomenes TaxID=2734909 RepID=UPI001551B483|nr:UDP-2,3-diacylglucosamine diphosphatase LpxI [Bradyrhizobium aeschynomenes]NPU14686.1 UDP-2,3-diacylglucosamine diphosphatase LpxI [Bradyrhizobium aeschynomenes]